MGWNGESTMKISPLKKKKGTWSLDANVTLWSMFSKNYRFERLMQTRVFTPLQNFIFRKEIYTFPLTINIAMVKKTLFYKCKNHKHKCITKKVTVECREFGLLLLKTLNELGKTQAKNAISRIKVSPTYLTTEKAVLINQSFKEFCLPLFLAALQPFLH